MNKFLGYYAITEDEFSNRYWDEGESLRSIARCLGVDYETMRLRLHRSGMKVKTRKQVGRDAMRTGICRKHDANYGFFDESTPEMAWVLGWIASDGNIVGDLKWWSIETKDAACLEKMRQHIQYTGDLRERKDGRTGLIVHSREMVKSLLGLGMTPAKSLTLEYPSLPDELTPYFLRGYFEGDGWFYTQKTQYSTGLYKGQVGITTGSEQFALAVADILVDNGMKPTIKTRGRGKVQFPNGVVSYRHKTYVIRMTGYSVASFFEFIYSGADETMRLERKYSKFKDWYDSFGVHYQGRRLNPTPTKALHFEGVTNV